MPSLLHKLFLVLCSVLLMVAAQEEVTAAPLDDWLDPTAGQSDADAIAEADTIAARPGRWVESTLQAPATAITGDFSVFFQSQVGTEQLANALESDIKRGLEGNRARRRQEDSAVVWDVEVTNLKNKGNTEIEFDVTSTRRVLIIAESPTTSSPEEVLAAAAAVAGASAEALREFNDFLDFSQVATNTPMQSLNTLYREATGETVPLTISKAAVDPNVQTKVVVVTSAPAQRSSGRPGSPVERDYLH